jgi:hypothetical protein
VGATAHQCGRSCVARQNMLAIADGGTDVELAGRLELDCGRSPSGATGFVEDRCDDVSNEPRPGPPRVLGDAQIDRLINATLKTTPRCHALVTRSNAMHLGLSQSDGKTADAAATNRPRPPISVAKEV